MEQNQLKTDYKDYVYLDENKKYKMINNPDDTVSFQDVTDYSIIGDEFGANDINATNQKINEIANKTILTSLSDIGLSEFTTLDAIVTAVPNGKTLQLYLSNDNASTLYGTSGGRGNLPTNIAGLLTVQKENGIDWVYITYKTNLSVFENDK